MRRYRSIVGLLFAAAFLLVPAAQAFANGTATVNIEGTGSGEVSSVGGFVLVPGTYEGTPPIECSYTPPGPATGVCDDELSNEGEGFESIALHAIAAPGSEFAGWVVEEAALGVGFGCESDPEACLPIAEEGGHVEVAAVFALEAAPTFPLTVNKAGTGEGTVTSSPTGIDCGTECETEFEEGEEVTLEATPEAGSEFSGWSGSGCTGTGTCVVTMSEAKEVTATFEPLPEFPLEITIAGTGEGEVSCEVESGPAEECEAEYPEGTEVALVPEAEAGSEFSGWSEDCTGTGACELIMTEAKEVTATFDLEPTPEFALEVSIEGTGSGTVESSPVGIDCPGECSAEFEEGEEVTLTPSPDAGSEFSGWSGDCTGTGACELTISEAKEVTASFDLEPTPEFALAVTKAGTGQGTVTSSPVGINCGSTCKAEYEEGTEVTLTATPASGSTFAGWTGACTGPEACKVTMSEARAVSATFTAEAVNPPPPPPPAGTGKAKAGPVAKVKAGKAALKLTCTGEGACKGTLKLSAKVKVGGKLKTLAIGKGSFSLAKGAKSTLKVKLSSPAKQAIAKSPLKARVKGTGVIGSTVKLKKA